MRNPLDRTKDRGVSRSVGVILMIAIVVALAALIAMFAVELSDSQGQNAQAGVSVEQTDEGVKIQLQESLPPLDRVQVLVDGEPVDGAEINQVGESVTVTAPEGETVSVQGINEDGQKLLYGKQHPPKTRLTEAVPK